MKTLWMLFSVLVALPFFVLTLAGNLVQETNRKCLYHDVNTGWSECDTFTHKKLLMSFLKPHQDNACETIEISEESCGEYHAATTQPAPRPTPAIRLTYIGCRVDVIFLVDSSGSIRDTNIPGQPQNWFIIAKFLEKVIQNIHQVKGSDARFAVITFATEAYFQFDFNKYVNQYDELLKAVDHLPYAGSHTNTSGALRLAEQRLIGKEKAGNRPDASDVIVLVTDGESTKDPELLEPSAARIRAKNVRIMCVGVTRNVTDVTIKKVISSPHDYFRAEHFNQLGEVAYKVSRRICHP